MKKINAIIPVLITILIFSCQQKTTDPIAFMKADLYFLASDSLKGREFGSDGEKLAAEYISLEFKKMGLKPLGSQDYLQPFFVKASANPHELPGMAADSLAGTQGFNVLGMIDNPGDEIVVIGAHFDHLGMGGTSSLDRSEPAIHNGADDNASGTAALLQLARILSTKKLNKDILFFAISGEEKGLWGSNYFVKNPTIDLSKVNYMLNMDMVGRLDTTRGLAINGTGTAPNWNEALDKVNTFGLPLIKKPSGIGPSDHTSFYLQDIPVLHFFTGQHEDYHKPSDDSEKINFEGLKLIVDYMTELIVSLDNSEKLVFTPTKDESTDTPRFTVSLGVVPDYLYNGSGMRIDGVTEGKPAHAAGLQKGDIVVGLGDSTVVDMMSYMRALSTFSKGQSTTVIIKRMEKEEKFSINF